MTVNLLPHEFELLELYIDNIGQIVEFHEITERRIRVQLRVKRLEMMGLDKSLPEGWFVDPLTISIVANLDPASVEVELYLVRHINGSRSKPEEYRNDPITIHADGSFGDYTGNLSDAILSELV